MEEAGYHNPLPPLELILGMSGCHSSFLKRFKEAAEAERSDLYRLIAETSALDRKDPSKELIAKVAESLRQEGERP